MNGIDGSAFARVDRAERDDAATTGSIGSGRGRLDLRWQPGQGISLAGLAPGAGDGIALAGGPAVALETDDGRFDDLAALTLVDVTATGDTKTARLAFTLEAGDGSGLIVHAESVAAQAIIRVWLEVRASTPCTITGIAPLQLTLADYRGAMLHTVSGVQRQGGWQPASGSYASFRLDARPLDTLVRLESGLRSTWSEIPWAAITSNEGPGVVLALEYGGRWSLDVAPIEVGARIVYRPEGYRPRIEPWTSWESPSIWIAPFTGDLDAAAALTHDYMRGQVVPATPEDFPWVQYNTWFSWYCELDEAVLLREADIAADLGVEIFYVDAGWWEGNPLRRDRFSTALGMWTENRDKFPHGLAAFAEEIRARGMHFGIWFEPERVDLRTAPAARWDPAWIARDGDRWIRCDWPTDTDTAWLCYGNRATQDWAFAKVADVIAATDARWLKWDSNYWGVCTSTAHDHGPGDGEAAQVAGVYAVLDRLRERFPDLIIENCAGGGTRMDFAIARHTHVAWLNDASEPAHRSRFHTYGASYLYPPEMLNAWVTESAHENFNAQDQPEHVIRATVRSRMIGALGFSCQLVHWTDRTRRIVAEEVGLYRERVRPLLRDGYVTHLLPQAPLESPRTLTPDVPDAIGLVARDGSRAVAFAWRNAAPDAGTTIRLMRLEPEATYALRIDGVERESRIGADLMGAGVGVEMPPLGSVVIEVIRAEH